MAGKYGPASVVITCDDAQGGTSRTVTPYIQQIGEVAIESITEETSPFGVSYNRHTPVGKVNFPDVELSGLYDTTATVGPHVVFGSVDTDPNAGTRTFTFAPGDSKTCTVELILVKYGVQAVTDKLSRFKAVVRQAGLPAWT